MKYLSVLALLAAAFPASATYTYDYSASPMPNDPVNLHTTGTMY